MQLVSPVRRRSALREFDDALRIGCIAIRWDQLGDSVRDAAFRDEPVLLLQQDPAGCGWLTLEALRILFQHTRQGFFLTRIESATQPAKPAGPCYQQYPRADR